MTLANNGVFSVGGTSDLGAGLSQFFDASGRWCVTMCANNPSSGTYYLSIFKAGASNVGSITSNGTTTSYNITSDQRLKTDIGTVTSTDVIANTVIHDFTWKSDGSQARGVFAQEAAKVLPAAVKVGDDGEEVTDQWQVDYSKYVPDIIVELQSLRAEITALKSQLKG